MKKLIVALVIVLMVTTALFAGGEKEAPAAEGKKSYTFAGNAEWPPLEYVDESGKVVGYEVELVQKIAEVQGVEIKYQNVAWDGIFAGLQGKLYDAVASGVSVTEERKQTMDFSSVIFQVTQSILTKVESPDYKNEKDLVEAKVNVGVQIGTTGDFAAQDAGIKTKQYDAVPEAVMALINGNIDVVVCDSIVASDFVLANPNYKGKLKVTGTLENTTAEDIAMVVNKGNKELLDLINEGYDKLVKDGTVDALKKKYNLL
ncbi:MAG: basic amino acid ABC transporter substrate-binding protein [Spirochaetales bacterium]|nr:basic amino acid ABC transporter substrate-binding protein [Spirochaetales bacterium]